MTISSDTQPPHFRWQKSLGGLWERDIDECENFYRLSKKKGHGCYPVTACASFVLRSSETTNTNVKTGAEAALRKAWSLLRDKHPTLGSRIEQDEETGRWKRTYLPFRTDDDERRWLQSTFMVFDYDGDALHWFNKDAPIFDASSVFLVRSRGPDSSPMQTVFLRSPHDVTDGIGVLQLINQLFDYASLAYQQGDALTLPEWGTEYTRLSPPLRTAASISEKASDATQKRFEAIQARNGTLYNHPALLGLPASGPCSSAGGEMQRVAISVPKGPTGKILSSCKDVSPGVTLTHAFLSALAQALAEVQPRKAEPYPVRYVGHSMINLRPCCRPPYDGHDNAAAAYHTVSAQAFAVDLVVPGSVARENGYQSHLPQIATQVRDFYKEIRPVPAAETPEQILLAPFMFRSLTPPPGSDPHAVAEPPFCPVSFSSIGNVGSMVAERHRQFELTRVWAASEPMGAGVAVFLGSWKGEIELSGVFDAQFHTTTYLREFLNCVVDCVFKGLRIDGRCTPNYISLERMED